MAIGAIIGYVEGGEQGVGMYVGGAFCLWLFIKIVGLPNRNKDRLASLAEDD